MRPCYFYTQNFEKTDFSCLEYEKSDFSTQAQWYSYAVHQECSKKDCYTLCPNFKQCCLLAGETYKKYKSVNVVINCFGQDRYDLVYYPEGFVVPEVLITNEEDDIDRSRKFKLVDNNLLMPLKDSATISSLEKTISKGSKRAQDNYFGYALANKWTHFFTFTFSPKFCEKYDDYEVKYLWKKFRQSVQEIDKAAKILCVPERHKSGSLHFHVLASFTKDIPIVDYGDASKLPTRTDKYGNTGFCTYKKDGSFTLLPNTAQKNYFVPYYDYGKLKRSSSGEQLFCLNSYNYGICSCAFLPIQDELQQLKVSNYLITYTTKEGNLGYNQKRYYRTSNLNYKNKMVLTLSEDELKTFLKENNMEHYSSKNTKMDLNTAGKTSRFEVYRNFNLRQSTEEEKQVLKERRDR